MRNLGRIAVVLVIWMVGAAAALAVHHRLPAASARPSTNAVPTADTGRPARSWMLHRASDNHQIEGYTSGESILPGGRLDVHVSTTASAFSADVYRMGGDAATGADLMTSLPFMIGHHYDTPAPDPDTGMVAAGWPVGFTLPLGPMWPSGFYLIKLASAQGYESYVPFVVRGSGQARLALVHSNATDQAYNAWGGKSLYDYNSVGGTKIGGDDATTGPVVRASQISFDRPLDSGDGAGSFLLWEFPMIRFLERNRYTVDYFTDTDVDRHPEVLQRYAAVLIVGHDEYWSGTMRAAYEASVAHGVGLGVFGADTGYWQVRFQPGPTASPGLVMVCYKDGKRDPVARSHPEQATVRFRDPLVGRPESELLGAMYTSSDFESHDVVFGDVSSPLIAGTRIQPGDRALGALGYEVDQVQRGYPTPPGLQILTTSSFPTRQRTTKTSQSTFYLAPSGAAVFNAGSIQWSWMADDASALTGAAANAAAYSPKFEHLTRNIVDALVGSRRGRALTS